jgi:hypothetical protein
VNPRERLLVLVILLVAALVGGYFLVHSLLLAPLGDREARIRTLQDDNDQRQTRINQIEASLPRLQRWKMLSLPADADPGHREYDLAYLEYDKYLSDLLQKSGFAAGSFTVVGKPPDTRGTLLAADKRKDKVFTALSYSVVGHANLTSLVKMLEGFYRTPLLHQIKNLSIRRPLVRSLTGEDREEGDLEINLTIEALILTNAEKRSRLLPDVDRRLLTLDVVIGLLPGPAGLPLAMWSAGPAGPEGPRVLAEKPRRYQAIAGDNIFWGPPPRQLEQQSVDVTRFVHLTDITHNDKGTEAWLYDRWNKRQTRLRAERGFDTFRVDGEDGRERLRGKVVRILARDLLLEINGKYYKMHVDDSLADILKRPLRGKDLEAFGVAAAPAARHVQE